MTSLYIDNNHFSKPARTFGYTFCASKIEFFASKTSFPVIFYEFSRSRRKKGWFYTHWKMFKKGRFPYKNLIIFMKKIRPAIKFFWEFVLTYSHCSTSIQSESHKNKWYPISRIIKQRTSNILDDLPWSRIFPLLWIRCPLVIWPIIRSKSSKIFKKSESFRNCLFD